MMVRTILVLFVEIHNRALRLLSNQAMTTPGDGGGRGAVYDLYGQACFLAIEPGDLLDLLVGTTAGQDGDCAAAATAGDLGAIEMSCRTGCAHQFNEAIGAARAKTA